MNGVSSMNLILKDSAYVECYTQFGKLMGAVPELTSYWYLISNLEVNGSKDERLAHTAVVLSGEELASITRAEDVQFIWAVLSAFRQKLNGIPAELPFADGNSNIWHASPRPQLPNAEFEIVCFDSSCTLFIGVEEDLAAKLRSVYPDIGDLDEQNEERANKVLQGDARKPARA